MGGDDFYARVERMIRRAIELNIRVEVIEPDKISVGQTAHMQRIIKHRCATAGVVFKIDGFTILAYNDPRYTPRTSFLQWTERGWDTPNPSVFEEMIKRITSYGA